MEQDKKNTDYAAYNSEMLFRSIFKNDKIGILIADKNGIVSSLNDAYCNIIGGTEARKKIIGKFNLLDSELLRRAGVEKKFTELYNGIPFITEAEVITILGNKKILRYQATPLFDEKMNISGAILFTEDITGQKLAENELQKSEKKLSSIIKNTPDIIYRLDPKGKISFVSDAVKKYGYNPDELIGKDVLDIVHPDDRELATYKINERRSGKRKTRSLEIRLFNANRNTVHMEITENEVYPDKVFLVEAEGLYELKNHTTKSFMGTQGIARDITERKELQQIMMRTEKMMTAAGLSAGVAHEINNPLGIILQGIQMSFDRLSPDKDKNRETAANLGIDINLINEYLKQRKIFDYLSGIKEAGIRAADIISNMVDFCSKNTSRKVTTNIEHLVENTIEIASADFDMRKNYDFKRIEIIRDYSANLPEVSCSKIEIEQVFLNLFTNSARAMSGHTDKPRIKIKITHLDENIVIEISDNGPGIKDEVLDRIFEPFFTTKSARVGTGLGLSISFYIITINHSGKIYAESSTREGATFFIELPLNL